MQYDQKEIQNDYKEMQNNHKEIQNDLRETTWKILIPTSIQKFVNLPLSKNTDCIRLLKRAASVTIMMQ